MKTLEQRITQLEKLINKKFEADEPTIGLYRWADLIDIQPSLIKSFKLSELTPNKIADLIQKDIDTANSDHFSRSVVGTFISKKVMDDIGEDAKDDIDSYDDGIMASATHYVSQDDWSYQLGFDDENAIWIMPEIKVDLNYYIISGPKKYFGGVIYDDEVELSLDNATFYIEGNATYYDHLNRDVDPEVRAKLINITKNLLPLIKEVY